MGDAELDDVDLDQEIDKSVKRRFMLYRNIYYPNFYPAYPALYANRLYG